MERWKGRVALVTGASVGIGAAVTRALVQHGMKVVGCARSVDKIEVNVLAVSICTREAYHSMRERNVDDGHIININSVLGHIYNCSSHVHFYSATKHMVTALTEGIRQELRELKSHIRVTSISPGVVETEFCYRLMDKDPKQAEAFYASVKCLQGPDIANAVLYALSTPAHVQVHEVIVRPTEQAN
ncbi:hypothetical protein GDO86_003401 [Hymenochirus boettgeri]|uniref:Dehydrogenase/reductase SDR family member 11 n=1 Tax=Hymenochirus boettgeri TaxID=247094 RepID=A0A8T2K645_9PIPI|nr:hypothetical protein GDO86_003401 [Hymenochirus boettgeri]